MHRRLATSRTAAPQHAHGCEYLRLRASRALIYPPVISRHWYTNTRLFRAFPHLQLVVRQVFAELRRDSLQVPERYPSRPVLVEEGKYLHYFILKASATGKTGGTPTEGCQRS